VKNLKKKVLVIEDSKLVLKAVRMALEINGFHVVTAKNGEEGLVVAAMEKPDKIVMDWNLPKLHGKALVNQLQSGEHTCGIPIIVMSATSKAELGGDYKDVTTREHFKKDSNVLERLVQALQNQVPALV